MRPDFPPGGEAPAAEPDEDTVERVAIVDGYNPNDWPTSAWSERRDHYREVARAALEAAAAVAEEAESNG